jgi:hypothetical protein
LLAPPESGNPLIIVAKAALANRLERAFVGFFVRAPPVNTPLIETKFSRPRAT